MLRLTSVHGHGLDNVRLGKQYEVDTAVVSVTIITQVPVLAGAYALNSKGETHGTRLEVSTGA